jgi:hypothetical protein
VDSTSALDKANLTGQGPQLRWPPERVRKFRQAAFVYMHVALLYEFSVVALWRAGLMPVDRGHPVVWIAVGAVIAGAVVWGLWSWQNRWFARVIWALHALRLPAVLGSAFFATSGAVIPPSFYRMALIVILINLWALARAGWDL